MEHLDMIIAALESDYKRGLITEDELENLKLKEAKKEATRLARATQRELERHQDIAEFIYGGIYGR